MNEIAQLLSLPAWPPRPGVAFWATLAVIAAALLGEVANRRLRVPRIVGYTLAGLGCSVIGLGLNVQSVSGVPRLVIETALGILLFEVGSRVPLGWLRRNKALLLTGLAETLLSTLAVALALTWVVGLPWVMSCAAAIILAAGAPSIAGRVSQELRASGQVTERLLVLSALSTLVAVLALTLLIGALHLQLEGRVTRAIAVTVYAFGGAVLLAAALAAAVGWVVRKLDLRTENVVLLTLALIVLAQAVASMFALSPLLVPLLAGVVLRNASERPWLWPQHFGTAGGVLVVLLFMAIGALASLPDLASGLIVAVFALCVRAATKAAAVHALAAPSGIGQRQATYLWVALSPVAATSAAMLMELYRVHPSIAAAIAPIVISAVVIMCLLGPLLVQQSLVRAGDVGDAGAPSSLPAAGGVR